MFVYLLICFLDVCVFISVGRWYDLAMMPAFDFLVQQA